MESSRNQGSTKQTLGGGCPSFRSGSGGKQFTTSVQFRTRKAGKKAKPSKKATRTKKAAAKPKADRPNKKAEVIAMMKRAKGATLPEIMKATGWQPHTVRGFVSILGSKAGEKIESSKNAAGERTYKIGK